MYTDRNIFCMLFEICLVVLQCFQVFWKRNLNYDCIDAIQVVHASIGGMYIVTNPPIEVVPR